MQLRGIVKTFGSRTILEGLDSDVEAGSRMGVIGPNGGGKSMLRILAGLEEPDAGESTQRRGLVVAYLPQQVESVTSGRRSSWCARRGLTSTSSTAGSCGSRTSSPVSAAISIGWRGCFAPALRRPVLVLSRPVTKPAA